MGVLPLCFFTFGPQAADARNAEMLCKKGLYHYAMKLDGVWYCATNDNYRPERLDTIYPAGG